MPQPGEEVDIKVAPSSPSISLQLHQEFAVFRSTLLTDIKSLLQAALQEVLDQHGVLIKGQETAIKQLIEEASGHVQAANDYYYSGYDTDTTPMINYDANTQPLILDEAVPSYGTAVEAGLKIAIPQDTAEPQHLRSRRAAHKKGEVPQKQKSAEIPRSMIPKGELPSARGVNHKMVLFGKSSRFLRDGAAIDQEPYDVICFYNKSGIMARIAGSDHFSKATLGMLFAYMVFIGADADSEKNSVGLLFFEHLFCIFFLLEILFRYAAFEVRGDCWRDFWFKYDSALVSLMVFESWFLPIALLVVGSDAERGDAFLVAVRMLRILRIVRIVRAFPEMITMVRAMLASWWAIFWALLMLGSLVYTFGIIMHLCILDEEAGPRKYWNSLPDAMFSLILHGVFLADLSEMARHLLDGGHRLGLFFFMIFVLVAGATVMNLLLGIIVEVVRQATSAEKEYSARAKVRTRLMSMLKPFDVDNSGDITKDQLLEVVRDPDVAALLQELEVDIPHLLEIQDMYYEGDDQVLRIPQILNMILDLRGDRPTTMQDMVNGLSFTRWAVSRQLTDQTGKVKEFLDQQVAMLVWQLRGVNLGPGQRSQLSAPPSNQLLSSLSSIWPGQK